MVRDESSANGRQSHSDSDPAPSQGSQPASLQGPDATLGAGNLTQELAQLLAATIAHNQAQRTTGGVPTGADLASLATLMSAATQHRSLSPGFKDGLSALSYVQPPVNRPSSGQAELVEPHHHDDEPMPIPSTWRQPTVPERDRWFRQQMGAAVLGLAAGLLIVIPAVLWLSGLINLPFLSRSETVTAAVTTSKQPDVKTVRVQVRPVDRAVEPPQFVTGSVEARFQAPEPARHPEPAVTIATAKKMPELQPPRPVLDEVLSQAARRVEGGDIIGAREILVAADPQVQGLASFALAETYDPNMLAAWGTRGAAADVARARSLYGKALDLGVGKAQARLDGLK